MKRKNKRQKRKEEQQLEKGEERIGTVGEKRKRTRSKIVEERVRFDERRDIIEEIEEEERNRK